MKKTIPVLFENVQQIDSRFQQVKIWLMHLGQNYNNSIFTKDAVEGAIETLKNTPILGYVEESRMGTKDFRGHEMELVVEGGELKTKYIGQAYGVIPENCNPRFEMKKGDLGQDLEYLVVDGLMWTKFDDGVDILNSHGEVAQSMELHDDYDGYFNNEGTFVFTRFSFYGACLLGQDVLPAMQKASVEVSFSANVHVYQEEIARKLEEYRLTFSNKPDKEVELKMTIEELLAKYTTTVEALTEKGIDIATYSIEDLEAKLAEVFAETKEAEEQEQPSTKMSDEAETEDVNPESEVVGDNSNEEGSEGDNGAEFSQENEVADETPEKFTLSFELSHEDIRRKLYEGLDSHITSSTGTEYSWNYIVSVYETHIITEDDNGQKFHMVEYAKDGDNIALGSVKEVIPMFLTAQEKGALELMRSSFEKYEAENTELKKFQADVLKGQHEALANEVFSQFDKLTEEDIVEIRENLHNFSIEDIEAKCFELVGRKTTKFTAPKPSTSYNLKLTINANEDPNPSGYSHYFKKHGISQ
jgi:hypothetical protein